MNCIIKIAAVLSLAPLAVACASAPDTKPKPVYPNPTTVKLPEIKTTTVNVKTDKGDRVAIRLYTSDSARYDYYARIRHLTRPKTDPLDRQRVLDEATRSVMGTSCPAGFTKTRPRDTSNYYERTGRFSCKTG